MQLLITELNIPNGHQQNTTVLFIVQSNHTLCHNPSTHSSPGVYIFFPLGNKLAQERERTISFVDFRNLSSVKTEYSEILLFCLLALASSF